MKYFSNFLALLLAMNVNAIMAQEVSIEEAQGRALEFLSNQTDGTKRAKGADVAPQVSLAYTSRSEGKTCFYVFNAGEDEGFVIIGGDEAAREILGYCDHGTFDFDKAPDNFKWWLSQYTEQIARAEKADATRGRRSKATTSRAGISSLIPSKWNQGEPFNNMVNQVANSQVTDYNFDFVTGCVATAMAQVMYKYKFPATGTSSYSYSPKTYSFLTFSANFGETSYGWNAMTDNYNSTDTGDAADAVATLMYHAGVSVDMDYNTSATSGSGAFSENIGYALATYFRYDKSVRNEFRTYYTDDDWENLVYKELQAGRPVLYSGQASSGSGHQFICDGYDAENSLFTFNWGWGGYCDGSFPLTGTGALQPLGSGIGGAGSGSAYTEGQMIVLCVMPDAGGSAYAHLGQIECPATGGAMYLKIGDTIYEDNYDYNRSTGYLNGHLFSSLKNLSCISSVFDYGVKAVNIANESKIYYSVSRTNVSLQRNNNYIDNVTDRNPIAIDLQFYPSNWDEGTYQLRPVCRLAGQTDEDWVEVDKLLEENYPTITISGELPTESVYLMEEPYFNNGNNPYEDDLKLHFKVKNNTSSTTTVYVLYIITIGDNIRGRGISYNNVPSFYELEGYLDLSEFKEELEKNKSYTINFYSDNKFSVPYNYPSISFIYRDKLTVDYGVSPAGYGTLILPFNATLPDGMKVYSCSEVTSNGVLTLQEESSISRNKPYVVTANYNQDYSFTGPDAIDGTEVSFQDGLLVGALTNDVSLDSRFDYILQVQNDEAAFYRYNGTPANRKAAQYRAFLRLDEDDDEDSNVISYALPVINDEEGIDLVKTESVPAGIYSIDGNRLIDLRKGLNVIVLDDGSVRKVFVK